jgi:hypothetical protein
MKFVFIVLVGIICAWLSWYYGAALGYTLWPDSNWIGPIVSSLGTAVGVVAGVSATGKLFGWMARRQKRSTKI